MSNTKLLVLFERIELTRGKKGGLVSEAVAPERVARVSDGGVWNLDEGEGIIASRLILKNNYTEIYVKGTVSEVTAKLNGEAIT